jgi:PAS domain-containing protein
MSGATPPRSRWRKNAAAGSWRRQPLLLFEAELIRKDGTTVRVEARTRAWRRGRRGHSVSGHLPTTERLQMQEELRASRERYQLLFDACPDLLYVTDTTGRLLQPCRSAAPHGLPDALRQKTFSTSLPGES